MKDLYEKNLMRSPRKVGFWVLLKGSWDLVTRVIIKVTILIFTYNPRARPEAYLEDRGT